MRYALKLENSNNKKFLFNNNNYLLLIIVLYIVEVYLLQFRFTFLSLCQKPRLRFIPYVAFLEDRPANDTTN